MVVLKTNLTPLSLKDAEIKRLRRERQILTLSTRRAARAPTPAPALAQVSGLDSMNEADWLGVDMAASVVVDTSYPLGARQNGNRCAKGATHCSCGGGCTCVHCSEQLPRGMGGLEWCCNQHSSDAMARMPCVA